jgi:hypothetical protein
MRIDTLPRQVIIVSIVSMVLLAVGTLLIAFSGLFEGSFYCGCYSFSIAIFMMFRILIMKWSFQEARASIMLAQKFRVDAAEMLDDFDRDDLEKAIRKSRSACGACRKCWSMPRATVILFGLGIGGFTMAISIIALLTPGIGGWTFAICTSGIAIALIEMVGIARESTRVRTCAKAYTMSRRASEALKSIVRNA